MTTIAPTSFKIISAECGYGQVKTDGTLGYETPLSTRVTHPGLTSDTLVISAHAPSRVEIELMTSMEVFGFLNATANSGHPVVFTVNDNPIGMAAGPLQGTDALRLPAGRHWLKALTAKADCRHSVWALKPCAPATPSRLAVVTVGCYPERESWQPLWHLCRSLFLNGMSAHVFGVGTEYRSHADAKIVRLAKFISDIDADYILFTDARDVLVIAGEEEIVAEFKRLDTDFVVSMERGCWPIFDSEWREAFPMVHDNRRWPNAGNWMGTKSGVLRVLEHCRKAANEIATGNTTGTAKRWEAVLTAKTHDDQALLQLLYLDGHIVGDKDCRIFTNVGTASSSLTENGDYEFNGNRVIVSATGTRPQVIHFSGNACAEARDQWAAILGIF